MNIVLSGHKHVPYVWRLENLYVANAGTVASLRVRGYTKPCYNVLEFEGDEVQDHAQVPVRRRERDRALLALDRRAVLSASSSRPVQQRPTVAQSQQGE